MLNQPTKQARCSCGAPSKWIWDDIDNKWYETICWRCLEIKAMKGDKIAAAMLPMDTNQIDKFVDLIIDPSVLMDVTRMSKPRPHTDKECREKLLAHLKAVVLSIERDDRNKTSLDKLDQLVFSVLVLIDGCTGFMPAFKLQPGPHPDDKEFHRNEGENWWPDDIDVSDGELHSRWAQMRVNKVKP